jgi:hypothetical protein
MLSREHLRHILLLLFYLAQYLLLDVLSIFSRQRSACITPRISAPFLIVDLA